MSVSKKGPIVDPGKCRCCGTLKKCRLLNYEYESFGKREVYSEMFVDCFGLVLSHLDGEESERLICATCVVRLRDARAFIHQVLRCEEQLLSANVHIHEVGEDSRIKLEVKVKHESTEELPPVTISDDGMDTEGPLSVTVVVADENSSDDSLTDDRDVDMDAVAETPTVSVEIKREATPPPETSTRRAKQPNKQRLREKPTDGAITITLDPIKANKMDKLQRIKAKLSKNKKIPKDPILKPAKIQQENRETSPIKQKRAPVHDKEMNTLRNTLTIIENSYVTPFIALFSDYHCLYCQEMFLDPDKLREHTLEHDPRTYQEYLTNRKMALVDVTRIDCRLCQTNINSIDVFKEHITSVHKKVIYKDVDPEFIRFKLKIGKLQCLECDKNFNYFQALKKHMAEHFGTYICEVCGAHYFEERHLIYHKKTHVTDRSVELFPCSECEKTFRSKNSRNFHVSRIHKNEAAYLCNKCDEVFLSYHMRYRHKMNVHGEKREFPCEQCDKIYDCRKSLREHVQRTHLLLLRHECNVCDKKFYLPSALRDHMASHTGERLYRCDYCGKNYPRKKALKVHMQSHFAEKKYKCTLCPCSYTQVNNFKNHMKTKHPMPQAQII